MQSKLLTLAALLGLTTAAPSLHRRNTTITPGDAFGLIALRSGSAVHFQPFQAYQGSILAGTAAQNATCDTASNTATFTLNDAGELGLYSTDAPFQTTYVDASGMGQGVFQYTTGAEPISRNGQRSNFTLDAYDDLSFNGAGFIACPYLDSWTIWVDAGIANPGGNVNCTGIAVRATKIDAPVSCLYSE